MRNFLLFAFLLISTFSFGQYVQTFNGNTNSGFGGAVGNGTLSITDKPDSLIFTLQKGAGPFDSLLVIYLAAPDNSGQTKPISSTSELPGYSDRYSAAAAGATQVAGQRAVLNFPADFHPNAAVVFDNNGGKIFYFVDFLGVATIVYEQSAFTVSPAGTSTAPVYTAGESKTKLGISGNIAFKFLATYIGPNASRSNEAIGDPFTGYLRTARTASYSSYNVISYLLFASTLPVNLTDFKATKERDGVNLSWSVAQESGINNYDVQRSGNGLNFKSIKTMTARNASSPSSYSVKDVLPNTTGAYYRLAITENGKTQYSKVVYVSGEKTKGSLVASLQSANALTIALNGIAADKYKLSVLNNAGQIVHESLLQHDGTNLSRQLNLQSNLSKGIYRVVLQSATDKFVAAILVQ